MTVDPQSPRPEFLPDLINLDELFRDAKPVDDLSELAIPDFFESDEEFDEFLASIRIERDKGMA